MTTISKRRRTRAAAAISAVLALAGCAVTPSDASLAEVTPPVSGGVVVAANPLAAAAAQTMLARGGTPIDAAVAAQAVLGLVEPQASGPGGGAVLLTWRPAAGGHAARLRVFDGTARAGRAAPRGLNADMAGRPLDPASVVHGGGAVGVPGTLPVLFAAHAAEGALPWADLFAPAIQLAEGGFPMPRALHDTLAAPGAAATYAAAAEPYLAADGRVPAVGATVRNRAYAAALRRVSASGPAGLYDDADVMTDLLEQLHRGPHPSALTEADLLGYAPTEQPPLCMPWRDWRICTAPPPSYGGLVAMQVLAMAGAGDLGHARFAHKFLEAGRLAQADRRRYVGDPDFVGPADALLDADYLAERGTLIAPTHAMVRARPGDLLPAEVDAARRDDDPGAPTTATTQIVIADRDGRVLTMTSSLTHTFGARIAAGGVVYNNALANFAPLPPTGAHYANEMAPGKRPAGPAAPIIVFDRDQHPVLLGGSGGGPGVPDFVAAAVLDMLTGHRAPATALARPHLTSADPDHVAVEAGTAAEALIPALTELGHKARAEPLPSGSAFLLHTAGGWVGAADPRRDGVALGP